MGGHDARHERFVARDADPRCGARGLGWLPGDELLHEGAHGLRLDLAKARHRAAARLEPVPVPAGRARHRRTEHVDVGRKASEHRIGRRPEEHDGRHADGRGEVREPAVVRDHDTGGGHERRRLAQRQPVDERAHVLREAERHAAAVEEVIRGAHHHGVRQPLGERREVRPAFRRHDAGLASRRQHYGVRSHIPAVAWRDGQHARRTASHRAPERLGECQVPPLLVPVEERIRWPGDRMFHTGISRRDHRPVERGHRGKHCVAVVRVRGFAGPEDADARHRSPPGEQLRGLRVIGLQCELDVAPGVGEDGEQRRGEHDVANPGAEVHEHAAG
jgi:hypothetical protein